MAIRQKRAIEPSVLQLLLSDDTARRTFSSLAVNRAASTTSLVSELRLDFKAVRKALDLLERQSVVEREMGAMSSSAAIEWWRLTRRGVQVAESLPPSVIATHESDTW